MLTFLRKIRKSLIESGTTRKYLFYAVGEIALVVIGILIALQINNWNEFNNQKKAERRILVDLKNEVNEAIESKVKFRNLYQSKIDTISLALDKLFSEDLSALSNSECIHVAFTHILNWEPPSISTIEELITAGKIDLITSEDLRKKMVQFRSASQSMEQTLNRSISEINVLVDKYPNLIIRRWNKHLQWYTLECDILAMKHNPSFLAQLQSNRGRTQEMVILANKVIDLLEDMNELIE